MSKIEHYQEELLQAIISEAAFIESCVTDGPESMQRSQAVLNLAHALQIIKSIHNE
jgi:hypothetical protein